MANESTATLVKQANELYEQGKHKESFQLYSQAAELGDTYSLCRIGQMYAEGDGVKKDAVKAFEFFQRSSVDGNRDAVFELGRCYFDGLGTDMDQEKGYELVLSSANDGFAPAQNYIGAIYELGEHVEKNDDTAFVWLKKSADQGFPKALFNMSRLYQKKKYRDNEKYVECLYKSAEGGYPPALYDVAMRIVYGQDREKSIRDAIANLNAASAKGHVLSHLELGLMYYRGDFVEKDYADAERHLIVAAEHCYTEAMYTLGNIYGEEGTDMYDPRKSLKMYEKAAKMGDPRAMGRAAAAYYFGDGTKRDNERAFKLFKKSAKAGAQYSTYWLGRLYREGSGTPKNTKKAFKWLTIASDYGFHEADYELGLMHLYGDVNGHNDTKKAIKAFRYSAEKGCAPAMYQLGRYYEYCEKEKSFKEAIYWYKKSADLKFIPAMMALADHYQSGSFILLDYDKAFSLYNEVYNISRDERAAANIGYMYEFGFGRDVDIDEAKRWYHIAVKDDNGYSMYRLGFLSWKAGDDDEATYWLRRAASCNFKEAMIDLAKSYETGDGVPQSFRRAVDWYHRASDKGNEGAKERFEALIDHIDDEDEEDFPDELRRLAGEEKDVDAMLQLAEISKDEKSKRMWLTLAAELECGRARALLAEMDKEAKS